MVSSLCACKASIEEHALIRQVLDGKREAFGDLIAPHLAPLSRLIQGVLGQRDDVEDIVQWTALKAFSRLHQFRFEASFKTWLLGIGLNEARQWRRQAINRRLVPLAMTPAVQVVADQRHSPFVECQRNETAARLQAALLRLPEADRIVLMLREFEQRSVAEVAKRMRLTIPAIKARQFRARKKMARLLRLETQLNRRVGRPSIVAETSCFH